MGTLWNRSVGVALGLVLALACAGPAKAINELCETDPAQGFQSWGLINVLAPGTCPNKGADPDADDIVSVVSDSTIYIVNDILYNTPGSALEVRSGGTIFADTATGSIGPEDAIVFHFWEGQDGITTGSGSNYDNVAFWGEANSRIELTGSYLTRSAAVPVLLSEASWENENIWVVDAFSTCDVGTANTTGWEVEGGDCTTGDEEYGFTLAYTEDRNNPAGGDNYLEESIAEINTDFYVCPTTGMDRGFCYQVLEVDSTANTYNISLDLRQLATGYTSSSAGFPLTDRAQLLGVVEDQDFPKGSTCIEQEVDDADIISTSGDWVGACVYFYDDSTPPAEGWERPIRIVRTEATEDCDGAAGGGAFHFAKENTLPETLVADSSFVVSPACIGRGDQFVVLAPVQLVIEDGVGWALGDGKIVLEGDITMHGVIIAGSGLVTFELGATTDLHMVHVHAGGDNGEPAVQFLDMTTPSMSWSSVVGGPETDDGNGIHFETVVGRSVLDHIRLKYIGGHGIYTTGASGPATTRHITCERIGHAVAADGDGCLEYGVDDFDIWRVFNLFSTDASHGAAGRILSSTANRFDVTGVAVAGQTQGTLGRAASVGQRVRNLVARGVDSSSGQSWLGSYTKNCDIDGQYTAGSLLLSGAVTATIHGCRVSNYGTGKTALVDFTETSSAYLDMQNNIFHNTTSSAGASCADGVEDCWLIELNQDNDTDSISTIWDTTVSWAKGQVTKWTGAFWTDNQAQDPINFDGNSVDNMVNDEASVDSWGINLGANSAADIVYRPGHTYNNCVSYGEAVGALGTFEYVDDFGSYTRDPILGRAPEFEGIGYGRGALKPDAYLARRRCGARTGPNQPGMRPGHDWLYEVWGFPEPNIDRVLTRPQPYGPGI